MILLATPDQSLESFWRETLSRHYEIYERVVSEKHSLEMCLKKAKINLILVDSILFQNSGVHEISDIHQLRPDVPIVIFTEKTDPREEIAAILFGAKAYCPYALDPPLLLKIIKTVLADEVWVDRKFVTRLLHEIEDISEAKHTEAQDLDQHLAALTPRECQIAKLVAGGASNRKIATDLNISERTVKAHLGVIFRKMNIHDRLQLALFINRHRQIAPIWHRDDDEHS